VPPLLQPIHRHLRPNAEGLQTRQNHRRTYEWIEAEERIARLAIFGEVVVQGIEFRFVSVVSLNCEFP
jgi:hypothetical protein